MPVASGREIACNGRVFADDVPVTGRLMSRAPLRYGVLSLLVVASGGCSGLLGDFALGPPDGGAGGPTLDGGGLDAGDNDHATGVDAAHADATTTGTDAGAPDVDAGVTADAGLTADAGADRTAGNVPDATAGGDADAHLDGPNPLDGPVSEASAAEAGSDADGAVAPPTCETGGSCAPVLVTSVTGASTILSIAAAGPYLYILESDSTQSLVYRVPTSGGSQELLSYPAPAADSNGNPLGSIAADVSYVYGFAGGGSGVSRLPSLGGNFAAFASAQGVEYISGLRVNGSYLVFSAGLTSNYLESVSKSSGGAATRIVTSLTISGTFAIDDAYIYVGQQSGTSISRVPIAGGGATPVATPDPGEAFDRLEVSGDQVVFTSSTRVGKAPAAGGGTSTLDLGPAFGLVTDATRAFFFRANASPDGGTPCASGAELYAVQVGGGSRGHAASERATGGGACPYSVVADANAVYWVAGDGQAIEKMPTAGL